MVLIGTLHTVAHAESVAVVASFPQVPVGQIKLLATWTDWVPVEGVIVPFKLQPDDWIVAVVTPTVNENDRLRFSGMSIETSWGWQATRLVTGVEAYRVLETHGTWMLQPEGSTTRVALLIFRGVQNAGIAARPLKWNLPFSELSVAQEAIPYSAPAAEIVRVVRTYMHPDLSPLSWSPYNPHWGYVVTPDDYDINPNWQVTVEINSRQDLSPADATTVYANGGWDDKYGDADTWGEGELCTIILSTQAVDLLPEDPNNPAPVGGAHLPWGANREEGLGIVDEEGNQLVDENGDTLIWS